MFSYHFLFMRGFYIILFGIFGLLLLGCVSPVDIGGKGEEVIITTDQECIGCADEEEPEEETEEVPEEEEEVTQEGLTLEEARQIALNSSCMEEGNITDNYTYNNYTHTWWFDMDIEKPGCAPACVVDELNRSAEINWRCTGLIPENETTEENETTTENETEEFDPYENATGCVGPNETEYNIYILNETWYHGKIYIDECALATVVKDYYCKDGELKNINTECPSGYDCRDGVCKEMEYKCTKTFGNDTTVKGHIVVSKGLNTILDEYDECMDEGTIKEWVCYENGSGGYELLYCGSGLKCPEDFGRCVRSDCKEDDGGDVPEIYGTVEVNDEAYHDTCISDKRLKEYYCYGDSVRSKTYTCMNDTCEDDQCVPAYT